MLSYMIKCCLPYFLLLTTQRDWWDILTLVLLLLEHVWTISLVLVRLVLTNIKSSAGHTEVECDSQCPHPLSTLLSFRYSTSFCPQKTLASSLVGPTHRKRRENAVSSKNQTHQQVLQDNSDYVRPWVNEDVYHQKQKKRKREKGRKKRHSTYHDLLFIRRHKLILSLENECATPKQGVYPRHHNMFINLELSYLNYTKCLPKLILSCNIKWAWHGFSITLWNKHSNF